MPVTAERQGRCEPARPAQRGAKGAAPPRLGTDAPHRSPARATLPLAPPASAQWHLRADSQPVQTPRRLQLDGPQSKVSQAGPRQKPVQRHSPSTQAPWPLQSAGSQAGSWMHSTVEMRRGQRHMLSKELGTEDRSHQAHEHHAAPSPTRNQVIQSAVFTLTHTGKPDHSKWGKRNVKLELSQCFT